MRLGYLDGLRGVAILLVIVVHVASHVDPGPSEYWLAFGSRGVQLFFVISAITIMTSLTHGVHNSATPFLDFFIKRFVRIASVYYTGIALYVLFYGMGSRGWREAPAGLDFLYNTLFVNVLVPGSTSTVVPGGWSISVEMIFYLFAPLLFVTLTTLKRSLIAAVLLTVVGVIVARYFPFYGPDLGLESGQLRDYWFRSPIVQFAFFVYGIVTFQLIGQGIGHAVFKHQGVWLAFVLAALVLLWATRPPATTHFVTFLFCIAAMSQAYAAKPILDTVVLRSWGRVSFSAYLLHFIVIDLISEPMARVIEDGNLRFVCGLLATLTITFPVAYLMFRVIEKPMQNAVKIVLTTRRAATG